MLGRTAYHDPMLLTLVDERVFGAPRHRVDLRDIIATMAGYADEELRRGTRLNQITRHMLGLANAKPGARTFRQILSVDACRRGAGPEVIWRAFDALEPELALV